MKKITDKKIINNMILLIKLNKSRSNNYIDPYYFLFNSILMSFLETTLAPRRPGLGAQIIVLVMGFS